MKFVWIGLTAVCALAISACDLASDSGALRSSLLVVAHRGGASLAPENSLSAFRNAIALGVDQIECDVHLSADGQLVVMHDADVSRTTKGSGQLGRMTLAEIRQLDITAKFTRGNYPSQAPPTLDEVLDLARGRVGVQIEIKQPGPGQRYPGIEKKVIDALAGRDMVGQALVISFDFFTLQEVKRQEPKLRTGALVNNLRPLQLLFIPPGQLVDRWKEASNADFILASSDLLTRDLIGASHDRGTKICTWTVDRPEDMKRFASWGIDGITTDRPDVLKSAIGR